MKKLILLTLATLMSFTALAAAHPPTPYCCCDFCSMNEEKVCEEEPTGMVYPCSEYSALNCPSR